MVFVFGFGFISNDNNFLKQSRHYLVKLCLLMNFGLCIETNHLRHHFIDFVSQKCSQRRNIVVFDYRVNHF